MIEPLTIELGAPASSLPRRHAVVRTTLVNRLCAAVETPVVAIVAPAGYGKTTLLEQWSERDRRRSTWLTLASDDDREALASRLAAAVTTPRRLVLLDDVHVLRSPATLAAVRQLLGDIAAGTTVGFAARTEPALLLPRLRAEGRLLELGAGDLALSSRETRSLLRHAGVLLPEREVDELEQRTEGWPAGLYLAALSVRAGVPPSLFAGDDRFVADYLEAEHLARLSPALRRFAVRTSVLDELSADACDSLVERDDSADALDALEREGLVVPLDHRRIRYRYRRLVRDVLHAELDRSAPAQARALHRSAAAWSEEHGAAGAAIRHAAAAGDLERVAGLAATIAVPTCGRGRLAAVEGWLDLLADHPALERHPDLCFAGSWVYALRGRPNESRRLADAAARSVGDGDARLRLLSALRCRDGADQMLDDASAACPALPPGSAWLPYGLLARGVAHLLAGDAPRAETDLHEAAESASAAGAAETQVLGLCLRALLAAGRDAPAEAEALVDDALSVAEATVPDPSAVRLLLEAVSARAALRRGDREQAAAYAGRAEELLPFLTSALPWLSTLAALELARVRLALADADGARELLRRAADVFRVQSRLGTLVEHAAELDRQARALSEPEGRWASSLTPAETRLLPLLATHLSFREIGERLFISRNTVKTQAISVYRKFGVSSRSEAITRAVALGLIEDSAVAAHRGLFTPCGR